MRYQCAAVEIVNTSSFALLLTIKLCNKILHNDVEVLQNDALLGWILGANNFQAIAAGPERESQRLHHEEKVLTCC